MQNQENEPSHPQNPEQLISASGRAHAGLERHDALQHVACLLKTAHRFAWVGFCQQTAGETRLQLLASSDVESNRAALTLDWRAVDETGHDDPAWGTFSTVESESLSEVLKLARHTRYRILALPDEPACGLILVTVTAPGQTVSAGQMTALVDILALVARAWTSGDPAKRDHSPRLEQIRAQAASEEREALLRQIVHDVRNTTQAMSLLVEELEMHCDEPETLLEGFRLLNQHIDFIGNFLKEKLQGIKQGLQQESQPHTALRLAFKALQERFGLPARSKGLCLDVEEPEAVDLLITPVQFEQVMANLLDNAIKFTPQGESVKIYAECIEGWATIWVVDSGPGIAPANRRFVGDLGWREHSEIDGSGFGLVTVREIVTQAGGVFGLARAAAQGCSFYVSLPTTRWGRSGQRHNDTPLA